MCSRIAICACLYALLACPLRASESDLRYQLLPNPIVLWRVGATQQLVVEALDAQGRAVSDVTEAARMGSADPSIAVVDEARRVVGLKAGKTTLTVQVEGVKLEVPIEVRPGPVPYVASFRNDVIPVLTKAGCNSGACHGAAAGKGGLKLSLRGYDPASDYRVLTRQARSRRTDPRHPGRSLVLLKPTMTIPHGGGLRFEVGSDDYWILADWIAHGCPPPTASDPHVERLEVLPHAVRSTPGRTQRFIVLAHYSDGTRRDVTRWCKFSSSNMVVATAAPDGTVAIEGRGEAKVYATFGNLVAAATIVVPYRSDLSPSTFSAAEQFNFVDELVLEKLAELGIPPAAVCDDRTFIRRAYLDATGTLPPPEKVRSFVADNDPQKRAKLIEELLQSEAFVDYWTYWLCDMFLLSSEKLPQPALWAFQRWLRQAVADNMSWQELARRLLTASGSNLENGAANYYVLHKDVVELTETTSVTFLGTSLTCARCHNHPLEKWTQDQYYSMANLFARVRLKNGKRPGEIIVYEAPEGEVLHPRRGVPMPPAPLDAPAVPDDYTGTRRQYLAQWMTSAENSLFARSIVNRVWAALLGRGIVDPPDDLRITNPAANDALLERLSKEFVAHGYDLRWLIATIMNSATYQRSSVATDQNAFDGRWGSHYLIRRLSAEVLADAFAYVTGVPDRYPGYPKGTRAIELPDVKVASYFLDVFGRPKREQPCSCERQNDASIAQTLHLFNGETLNEKLKAKGGRIDRWLQQKLSLRAAIERLYELALARRPTADELSRLATALGTEKGPAPLDAPASREQLEDLFWAVLTSREFTFNH